MWDTDATIDIPSSPFHRGRPVVVPPVDFGRRCDSPVLQNSNGGVDGGDVWTLDWNGWMRSLPANAIVLCIYVVTTKHVLTMLETGMPTQSLVIDPHPIRAFRAVFETLDKKGGDETHFPTVFTVAQKRHASWDAGCDSVVPVDSERTSCLHKRACAEVAEFNHAMNTVKTEAGTCPRCHVFLEDRKEHVDAGYCPPEKKMNTRGMQRFNARTHTFSNKPRNGCGSKWSVPAYLRT